MRNKQDKEFISKLTERIKNMKVGESICFTANRKSSLQKQQTDGDKCR